MAEVKPEIKRHISDEFEDLHDDKKQHFTKPGRKPIDTEPKSKRTAQNRAAQRAYRERKEKRMKELEDKVKSLEDENVQVTTESDFLKAQVDLLKNELSRYRGQSDFSDINLPTKVGHLSNPKQKNSSVSSSLSSGSSNNNVSVDFPWSAKNLNSQKLYMSNLPDLVGGASRTTGSSTSSSYSPLDNNLGSTHGGANGLVSPESSSSNSNPNTVDSNQYDGFDFGIKFEEEADPFCEKLNEACGSKECPVPKYKAPSIQSIPTTASNDSPFSTLIENVNHNNHNSSLSSNSVHNYSTNDNNKTSDNNNTDLMNDPFFNGESADYNFPIPKNTDGSNDPLSFLNDNDNFDISLAFGENYNTNNSPGFDPISLLTTEESVYDPFKELDSKKKQSVSSASAGANSFDFNEYVQTNSSTGGSSKPTVASLSPDVNSPGDDDDDNEVVPAPEETVRCSEIWDRITSHPKYTEIDIDSLCNELKSKAKCSEKGVVINSSDVNKLLEQSVSRH